MPLLVSGAGFGVIAIMTRPLLIASAAQPSTLARPVFMSTVSLQPTSTFVPSDSTTSLPDSTRISVFMSNVPRVAGRDLRVRLDVDLVLDLQPSMLADPVVAEPLPSLA